MVHHNLFLILCGGVLVMSVIQHCAVCSEEPSTNIRVKRQSNYNLQDGNNFIDSIFQIPISTLTAVGSLIKNTRPIVMRARERIQQQYEQYQQNQQNQQNSVARPSRGSNYYTYNKRINKKRRNGIQGRDYGDY